jgi:hypothetical protein
MGLLTMSERDLKRIEVLTELLAERRTALSAVAVLGRVCGHTVRYTSHGGSYTIFATGYIAMVWPARAA